MFSTMRSAMQGIRSEMASLGQIIEKIVEETGLCPVSFRPCAPRVAPRYPLTLIARTDLEDLRMTASPTHQVKTALNEIFTPGVSRDDLKSRGKSLARRVQGAVRHACERQGSRATDARISEIVGTGTLS